MYHNWECGVQAHVIGICAIPSTCEFLGICVFQSAELKVVFHGDGEGLIPGCAIPY